MENKNQIQKFNEEQMPSDLKATLDSLLRQKTDKLEDKLEDISNDIKRGFIGLYFQNEELIKSNKKLKKQLNEMTEDFAKLKKERDQKEKKKAARAKRKRLPARDPITAEIYQKVIQEVEGTSYTQIRLRLAICLLAVTGVRINELLNIKVWQLKTLLEESSISINRSKGGPSDHKAFLTEEGKKLISDRKKDCNLIALLKAPTAFVFTPELNHMKTIRREAITKDVNKILKGVSETLPDKPKLTTHSFRIGYITKLWQDSKDIEFVRQVVGHQKIDTTSMYVKNLSSQQRKERIDQLK